MAGRAQPGTAAARKNFIISESFSESSALNRIDKIDINYKDKDKALEIKRNYARNFLKINELIKEANQNNIY